MSVVQRLFIGGPVDGRRLLVDERMFEIWIPVPREPEPIDRFLPIAPEEIERVMYVMHRIGGSSKKFEVFAPFGWGGDQLISALIRNYPDPENSR